jgi:hypothetical protein
MWRLASDDELPSRFTDQQCAEFRCVCSNGFEGDLSLGSAFLHKPARYPQCFPAGDGEVARCTTVILRQIQ